MKQYILRLEKLQALEETKKETLLALCPSDRKARFFKANSEKVKLEALAGGVLLAKAAVDHFPEEFALQFLEKYFRDFEMVSFRDFEEDDFHGFEEDSARHFLNVPFDASLEWKAIEKVFSDFWKRHPILLTQDKKPYMEGMEFSLSHSRELAICVVSDFPVGVDAETIRPFKEQLMLRFFTENECAYIQEGICIQEETEKSCVISKTGEWSKKKGPEKTEETGKTDKTNKTDKTDKTGKPLGLHEDTRNFRFLKIWTKKEAYLKATGEGLKRNLQSFDVLKPLHMNGEETYHFYEETLFSNHVTIFCRKEETCEAPLEADFSKKSLAWREILC